jgi:RimJ/RimL family protein N-acetyltransferase
LNCSWWTTNEQYHTIRRANHPDEVRYIYECLSEHPGACIVPVPVMSLAQLMDDAQRSVYWLIFADEKLVGFVSLVSIDWVQRSGEGGIVIREKDDRQPGVAMEAAKQARRITFDEMGLERVFARPGAYNKASIRFLQRMGWTHEGTLRHARYHQGKWWDQELYSVVKGD